MATLMPPWPEHAPWDVFASEYVPSLHSNVEPLGGLVDAVLLDAVLFDAIFAPLLAVALAAMFDVVFVIEFVFDIVFVIVFAAKFVFVFDLLAFELFAVFVELPPQAANASDAPRAIVSKNPVFIIFLAAPRRTRVPAPRTLFGI